VAYVLARWRFPGKLLLDGIVHLPLVLPPVVTGYALLLAFGRRGPAGAFLASAAGSCSRSAGPGRRWPAR
jgi:molybdate transport system permease protein